MTPEELKELEVALWIACQVAETNGMRVLPDDGNHIHVSWRECCCPFGAVLMLAHENRHVHYPHTLSDGRPPHPSLRQAQMGA